MEKGTIEIAAGTFSYTTLGEREFELYQQRLKEIPEQLKNYFNVLSLEEGEVAGSNPHSMSLMNLILAEENRRLATPREISIIVNIDDAFKGRYIDLSFLLRNSAPPNIPLQKTLYEAVAKKVGKTINQGTETEILYFPIPQMILFSDLLFDKNSESLIRIKEDAEIIYAEQFAIKNFDRTFNKTDSTGFPIYEENGSRKFYWNGEHGFNEATSIVRLSLNRLGSYADFHTTHKLNLSSSKGRIVACEYSE